MPNDMLNTELPQPLETRIEKTDPLLALKKNILTAFSNTGAVEDIAKLDKIIDLVQKSMDKETAEELINTLGNTTEGYKRCQSLGMPYNDFIKAIESFITTKTLAIEDFTVADIKTYCEIKAKDKINLAPIKKDEVSDEKLQELVIKKENELNLSDLTITKNKQTQIKEDIEYNYTILAQIEQEIQAKASIIKQDPAFAGERQKYEKAAGKSLTDEYVTARFALEHAGEPGAVLTNESLRGLKKYDLIASLNEKYGVTEIVPTQEQGFINNRMDGVISAETQQVISKEGGASFDTLFSLAEMDFFKKDSPLRTNLSQQMKGVSTPSWLQENQLSKYNAGTSPEAVAREEKSRSSSDLLAWVPQDIIQDPNATYKENKFVDWIERMQAKGLFPQRATREQVRTYFQTYDAINKKSSGERSAKETLWRQDFLTLLAKMNYNEAINHKNMLQDISTKAVAETMFQDVTQLVAVDMPHADQWKIIPDKETNQHFVIDGTGAMHINYMLHGVPGNITVQKDGKVFMDPVLQQGEGVSDIEYKKKQVGTIAALETYTANIQTAIAKDSQGRREHTPVQMQKDVFGALQRDPQAIAATKATMQTALSRYSFIDALLTRNTTTATLNPLAENIKTKLQTGTSPIIEGEARQQPGSFSNLLYTSYLYTLNAGQSEMQKAQQTYKEMQMFTVDIANQDMPLVQKIQQKPEYIATALQGKTPDTRPMVLSQWKHERDASAEQKTAQESAALMEKQYLDTPGKDWTA